MIDIQAKIKEIAERIKGDKNLSTEFQKEPVKTVEKLLGVDLPDEMVQKLVDGVKAKLAGGKAAEGAESVLNGIKGIFGN